MKSIKRYTKMLVSGVLALVIAWFLLPFMLGLSLLTGVGFLISVLLAFYKGIIFKKPEVIGYIAISYIIVSVSAGILIPKAYTDYKTAGLTSSIITLSIFLAIYLFARNLRDYRKR